MRTISKESYHRLVKEAKWVSPRDFDELLICRQDGTRCILSCDLEGHAKIEELNEKPYDELKADLATAKAFLEELAKADSWWGDRAQNILEVINK